MTTAGLVALLLVLGPILLQEHRIRQKRRCLHYLVQIDHALNCLGPFEHGLAEGMPVSSTFLLDMSFKGSLRCPSGPAYPTENFRVGSHPVCPRHGDLIAEVGYEPHAEPEFARELQVSHVRPWMVVCFVLAAPVAALIVALELRLYGRMDGRK